MELGTPARHHLAFPHMEVKRKTSSYKLLGKEKVAVTLRQSFGDLPPKKTLGPNQVIKKSVSIKSYGSSKVMKKICSKKDIHFSTASVKFDMARKYLKVEKMSASNRPLPSPERKVPLRNDNLSCSSRLHEAKIQQQKSAGRIEETCLEKPLVKKVRTSLDVGDADMENRYFMCIII